jgi:predicted membrane-bound dolichyl-phosphate-mannose-protein mannosyltransferase
MADSTLAVPREDLWDVIGRALERLLPAERHLRLLLLLLTVSLFLRILWLDRPAGALIFDEAYYVNASRVLLGIAPDPAHYSDATLGLDPNTEHPPLAKLLVAGSMAIFGDNAYGWRIPSVLAGMASIILVYAIVRRLHENPYVAVAAAGLLAFDNLVYVHSRIFTLDIFQLAFMLLGVLLYVRGRASLAGAGFGLAALCKIGGVFGLLIAAGYEALRLVQGESSWREERRALMRRLSRMLAAFVLVFFVLLGIMDRLWVGYDDPFSHVQKIVTYGALLKREAPSGIESYPWQWLWNERQIPYLEVDQEVMANDEVVEKRPVVLFLGALNPYILGLLPFGLAFAAYAWWTRKPGAHLGALALSWFAVTYAPFYMFSIVQHRISYLFYFLPTLPAVAMAAAYFLSDSGLPTAVRWTAMGAVVVGFYGLFPFKPVP